MDKLTGYSILNYQDSRIEARGSIKEKKSDLQTKSDQSYQSVLLNTTALAESLAGLVQRLRFIQKRVQTEAPFRKDREIAMLTKLLIDYIKEQHEMFPELLLKSGLKRRSSQSSLGTLEMPEAQDVRRRTTKYCFWEQIMARSCVRQMNEHIDVLKFHFDPKYKKIPFMFRINAMLRVLQIMFDAAGNLEKRSKDYYNATTHQVLDNYKTKIRDIIRKNRHSQ